MKRILMILLILSTMLFTSCGNARKFECYECGSTVELNEEFWEDEDGNSYSYNAYTCEDCAYEQGYIDGYNALVDELLYGGWPSDLDFIDEAPEKE